MLATLDIFGRALVPRGQRPALSGTEAESVRRILVIEPWNIGDVILLMPFLSQLRSRFPKATTTLLAPPHAAELLRNTGLATDFIQTDINWSEGSTRYNPFAYNWAELWRLRRELRERKFDLAFKCRMHVREHFVIGLSGANRRIGYAFGEGDTVLTDAIPIDNSGRHKVDDWLLLLQPFGGAAPIDIPRLRVSGDERRWADEYLHERGISASDTVVGIHPGASVPEKRWPLERFVEVAKRLADRANVRILVFVDPAGYGASLAEVEGVVTAQVGLRELIALTERCSILVCNDSGPMHIAGALGVPTVAVFGSGIEQWFSPLGEGHQLLTAEKTRGETVDGSPAVKPYDITGIATSQVLNAVDAALRANRN
jgi:heptosyltransferase-2